MQRMPGSRCLKGAYNYSIASWFGDNILAILNSPTNVAADFPRPNTNLKNETRSHFFSAAGVMYLVTFGPRAPFREPRVSFGTNKGYSRHQDENTPADGERSARLPSAKKTSRRQLVSDAVLLGAAGAGAVLARPSRAAAARIERGEEGGSSPGDGLALALPAVGLRTKRIFLARHGEVG